MNKTLLFIMITLLSSQLVLAAEYDYDLIQEYESNINTGEQDFGKLIFLSKIVNKTNFYTNLSQSINLTIHDSICNDYNQSISVGGDIIIIGSCKEITFIGNSVVSSLNSNESVSLISTPLSTKEIVLNQTNTQFPISFSNNNFFMNIDHEIYLTIITNNNLLPGDYNTAFKINNVLFEKDFKVLPFTNWSVEFLGVNNTISVGSVGVVGEVTINNVGNSFEIIDVTSDSGGLVSFPSKVLSYSGLPVSFDINFDVPNDYDLGNKSVSMSFDDGDGLVKSIDFNLLFVDDIKPNITNFLVCDSPEILRGCEVNVSVVDNVGVSLVGLQVFEGSKLVSDVNHTRSRLDIFEFEVLFDESSEHRLVVYAVDDSGNEASSELVVGVQSLSAVVFDDNIHFPKQNKDDFRMVKVAESDFPVDLEIVVSEFSNATGEWTIRFESDEEILTVDDVGGVVEFEDFIGNLSLGVKTDLVGEVFAKFEVVVPYEHVLVDDVSLVVEMLNYTIPDEFTVPIVGGEMSCEFHNVDDLDEAGTECVLSRKGLFGMDELSVPMTLKDREELDFAHELEVDKYKSKAFWRLILIILLLFWHFGFFAYYLVKKYVTPTALIMPKKPLGID